MVASLFAVERGPTVWSWKNPIYNSAPGSRRWMTGPGPKNKEYLEKTDDHRNIQAGAKRVCICGDDTDKPGQHSSPEACCTEKERANPG